MFMDLLTTSGAGAASELERPEGVSVASQKPAGSSKTRTQGRTPRKQRAQQRKQSQQTGPSSGVIGAVVTGLILMAILIVVLAKYFGSNQTRGVGLTYPNDYNPAAQMLKKGTIAPTFTLKSVEGKTYSLAAQRGHPVFLEFFAVWCPHCQAEAPVMARITDNFEPKGVRIWSILASPYGPNAESGSLNLATKADLQYFASHYHVTHPQLIDPTFHVVNEYGVSGYPGLYVINGKGVITYVGTGYQTYATLAHAIDAALRSK